MGNGSTWKTFVVAGGAAAALVAAALLSPEGCAGKAVGPDAGIASAAPSGPGAAAPSAADIEKWLTEAKLPFRATEPGKQWAVTFQGQNTGTITAVVSYGKDTTRFLVRLLQIPEGVAADFYAALLRYNGASAIKFSSTERNDLFLSYEIPNRVLDKRELSDDVMAVARAADQLYPKLITLAQQGLPQQPRPAPVASVPAQPPMPPGAMPPGMPTPGGMPPGAMAGARPPAAPPAPAQPAELPPPTPAKQGATVGNPFLSGFKPPPEQPENK